MNSSRLMPSCCAALSTARSKAGGMGTFNRTRGAVARAALRGWLVVLWACVDLAARLFFAPARLWFVFMLDDFLLSGLRRRRCLNTADAFLFGRFCRDPFQQLQRDLSARRTSTRNPVIQLLPGNPKEHSELRSLAAFQGQDAHLRQQRIKSCESGHGPICSCNRLQVSNAIYRLRSSGLVRPFQFVIFFAVRTPRYSDSNSRFSTPSSLNCATGSFCKF